MALTDNSFLIDLFLQRCRKGQRGVRKIGGTLSATNLLWTSRGNLADKARQSPRHLRNTYVLQCGLDMEFHKLPNTEDISSHEG